MKVMKFGGSSLADAKRYLRVTDITLDCHQSEGAAVVLSAPKGVTNALSLLCEQAASQQDYSELFDKLRTTLQGINDELHQTLTGYAHDELVFFIDEHLSWLGRQLEGFTLLGCAPDAISAAILSSATFL